MLYSPSKINNMAFNLEKILSGELNRNSHKMDVLDGATATLLLRCGDKTPVVKLSAVGTGDIEVIFSVFPIITSLGTHEPSGNYNFNYSSEVDLSLYYDTVVSSVGVVGGHTWIFGGSGMTLPNTSEVHASFEGDWVVLVPNVDFLIQFVNHAERDVQINFEMSFFER